MTWHYQIRRHQDKWYDLIEVYSRTGRTEDGMRPGSESRQGLIRVLEMMLRDAKKYRTIVEK